MAFHCYYKYSIITAPEEHPNMGPCAQSSNSSNLQCCGIDETCMSDGICAYSRGFQGGSGYYIGGCTDRTMQDARCFRNCTSFPNSDVVYDYDTNSWRCCGNDAAGNRNCSMPDGPQLPAGAPPPRELAYIATIVATGSSLPLSSHVPILSSSTASVTIGNASHATETVIVTTSPSDSDSDSADSLSPGASAGIAVAAVLALVIIAATSFWIIRRQRRNRVKSADLMSPAPQYIYVSKLEMDAQPTALSTSPATAPLHELDAQSRR